MAKGVVRLDRISNSSLYNLVHTETLENGMICNLGILATGEREVFKVAKPATATLGTASVVLVAAVEVPYEAGNGIKDFEILAGTVARGIGLAPGTIVTISENVIDPVDESTDFAVGQYLIAANDSLKLKASATAGNGSFVGRIIEKTSIYGVPALAILVERNAVAVVAAE